MDITFESQKVLNNMSILCRNLQLFVQMKEIKFEDSKKKVFIKFDLSEKHQFLILQELEILLSFLENLKSE